MIFTFWCLWVLEISETRRRSNVTFTVATSADLVETAATLKILSSASIYQPQFTHRHLRFRTCLWNCDETIDYFGACCFPAATLDICLVSIAIFSKRDVLLLDVVVQHAGVQRLIYLIADCWFLCSSHVWRGSRGWILFLNFCVAVRSRLSCVRRLGIISLSLELSFSLRLRWEWCFCCRRRHHHLHYHHYHHHRHDHHHDDDDHHHRHDHHDHHHDHHDVRAFGQVRAFGR